MLQIIALYGTMLSGYFLQNCFPPPPLSTRNALWKCHKYHTTQ